MYMCMCVPMTSMVHKVSETHMSHQVFRNQTRQAHDPHFYETYSAFIIPICWKEFRFSCWLTNTLWHLVHESTKPAGSSPEEKCLQSENAKVPETTPSLLIFCSWPSVCLFKTNWCSKNVCKRVIHVSEKFSLFCVCL